MHSLKTVLLCTRVNYVKWLVSSRIYIVLAVSVIFGYYTFGDAAKAASALSISTSPWTFAFYMQNPSLIIVFGGLIVLLFSNAPFFDRHTPFLIIRSGRKSWLVGQVLYIFSASFLFTLLQLLIAIAFFLPNMRLTWEWGEFLVTFGRDPGGFMSATKTGFGFLPIPELMDILTPAKAVLLAFLLLWLVSVFFGCLIMGFNIAVGGMSGTVVASVFVFISYFVSAVGFFGYGWRLYYISPLSWVSLNNIDWLNTGVVPSIPYILVFLLVGIVLFTVIGYVAFLAKDLNIKEEEA